MTGGSHHSVVIEMKDHLIVVESPLNDERALAILAEIRKLSSKPIRYLVVSHHHFDHSGGVRAFAGEGVTLVTHDLAKTYFEKVVAAPATVSPDHLAKSGKKAAAVEGVRDQRSLTDGTRTVEVRHIAGSLHADDLLMVYLPKEKFLIEADAYTPPAPNATPMTPPSAFTVNLVENITKQGLAVDQILPLHGRMVPVAELQKAAGHSH